MKNWQETRAVVEEAQALGAQGRPCALAVIVRLEGSAYRQPGAKVLVRDDGTLLGNVSGGCLEGDVRENALKLMSGSTARLLHYDTSGREDVVWGLGVGCNGKVDILVLPLVPGKQDGLLSELGSLLRGDSPVSIAYALAGDAAGQICIVGGRSPGAATGNADVLRGAAEEALKAGTSIYTDVGNVPVFSEFLSPPPHLVVCGAGDDAVPLVRLAAGAGFRVTVVDHRAAYLAPNRFPGAERLVKAHPGEGASEIPSGANALAVVKHHILAQDKGWIRFFAAAGSPYIGLLGSRSRREEILEGLDQEARSRVYGPVGLDLGAEGPEQVAISVVAEAMAVWAGRSPGHLRDRARPIHG